jgi:hypothetical protein
MHKNYKLWFTNAGGYSSGVMLETRDKTPVINGSQLECIVIGSINPKTPIFSPLYIMQYIKEPPTQKEIEDLYQEVLKVAV